MKKIVGIIGYPLGHSLSPAMHNAVYQKMKLPYEYIPFEVEPDELPEALTGLRALHIAGFNVTIPHKETIVPLLDEVTKLAQLIGAVNTVENQAGRLVGYNTDAPGFIESLQEDAGFEPEGKRVVIIGAGGASRAVGTILAEVGVKGLTLSDLMDDKAKLLAEYLGTAFNSPCHHAALDSPELRAAIAAADLVVNTSPVGMSPQVDASPLPAKTKFKKGALVYDLVYNPRETQLIKIAQAAGCRVCSGLGMLVRQGALAFSLFTGEEPPIEEMRLAAEHALRLQH
ncbi:MAG: shikimate dehydrogenase [Candidatus Margulisiibacteriota bacterium]